MKRRLSAWFVVPVALAALSTFAVYQADAAPPAAAAKPGAPAKPGAKPAKPTKEPTTVTSLAPMLESLKWGLSPDEVVKIHNSVQGVFDKDYNEDLIGMQPGIKMQEKMAERESAKIAFASLKKFEATAHIVYPGVVDEYTHGNKEAAHIRDNIKGRKGDRRFFF